MGLSRSEGAKRIQLARRALKRCLNSGFYIPRLTSFVYLYGNARFIRKRSIYVETLAVSSFEAQLQTHLPEARLDAADRGGGGRWLAEDAVLGLNPESRIPSAAQGDDPAVGK